MHTKSKKSVTKPISPELQKKRNWRVYLNGERVEEVVSVVIKHPKLGFLTYGETPLGYDGWSFREVGGGGSVIIPFAFSNNELFVGVVRQLRPNQGGEVWNVPRGFLDPGEDRANNAARELSEEFGLPADASKMFPLPGKPGNPNSTFFETWAEGEGVGFFGIEIEASLLVTTEGVLQFKPSVLDTSPAAQRSRLAEQITQARFIPWFDASQLGDLFSNAAVARLLVLMRDRGRFKL